MKAAVSEIFESGEDLDEEVKTYKDQIKSLQDAVCPSHCYFFVLNEI